MDRRHSTLFFDRLFSPLNCVHAANHKSRKIALHNLILPAFSLQNICRAISACRFRAASLYSGLIPEIALSSGKAKVEQNTAINRKLILLKMLLLSPNLQRQRGQSAGWLLCLARLDPFMTFSLFSRARVHSPAPASIPPSPYGDCAADYHQEK